MNVYHGSPNQDIIPTFGLGEEKHDYGKGFYLLFWTLNRKISYRGWQN